MDVNVYMKSSIKDRGLRLLCICGFLTLGFIVDRLENRVIKMEKEIEELRKED